MEKFLMKKKIKYEKPKSIDIGKAASVLGATCSSGTGAVDGCNTFGDNPYPTFNCPGGGSADSNCTQGNTAGAYCDLGSSAGGCLGGGSTT